jgi:hypothetical protein
MLKRIVFTLILCFVFPIPVYANFVVNENCKQAFDFIISLRFAEGKKLLEKERQINPTNQIPTLFDNYIDFLTVFISEKKQAFEQFKIAKDRRLAILEKENPNSPFFLYTQAEVYMQCGFTRIKFKEYTTAIFEIRKAYKLLEENTKLFPNFKANYKELGVLHALIGTIPENYKWIASAIGMKGTVQQGINELTFLNNNIKNTDYEYMSAEVCAMLAFINMYLEKNDLAAAKVMDKYEEQHKNYNPIACFIQSTILIHLGKNDEAIAILMNRKLSENYYPVPYLDYLTGMTKLYKLDNTASNCFLKYINNFKGESFVKSAYQKLAWTYLIQGNIDEYKKQMNNCKLIGNATIDEDKSALSEAESNITPNIHLLKSRLKFDGGYYLEALSELTGNTKDKFPTLKDKLELTYRLGRIYQKTNETDKAITLYAETLQNGAKLKYYFAASAALELGFIYELKNDKYKAKTYFEKCLSLRNHEYQNGIDQKAKAGLNRLGF